jgi:hypothetical protein
MPYFRIDEAWIILEIFQPLLVPPDFEHPPFVWTPTSEPESFKIPEPELPPRVSRLE